MPTAQRWCVQQSCQMRHDDMVMQSSRTSALRNTQQLRVGRLTASWKQGAWTLTAGADSRAEEPLKCFSCRTCLLGSRLLVFFQVYLCSSSWGRQMLLASSDRAELLREGGGCAYTMKSGTKTELNHVGHQFHLIFSIFLSGFYLPITCLDSLRSSHLSCQGCENPLRKSTAWTLADVWVQPEHDQADIPAPGVFRLLKPRKSCKAHF